MNTLTFPRLVNIYFFILSLVFISLLGISITLLQTHNKLSQSVENAVALDTDLDYARNDISVGMLHVTLGNGALSAWQKKQGIILLRQGLRTYEKASNLLPKLTPQNVYTSRVEKFQQAINNTADYQSLSFRLAMYELIVFINETERAAKELLEETRLQQTQNLIYLLVTVLALFIVISIAVRLLIENHNREKKIAEAKVRRSEDRWRFALEGSGDGIWEWDLTNDTVEFSPTWEKIIGWAKTDWSQHASDWIKLIHPDDQPMCELTFEQIRRGELDRYTLEHRIKTASGDWKWLISKAIVTEKDDQGYPKKLLGLFSDIDARKGTEAQIWQQANYDALTGCPNHHFLKTLIEPLLRQSETSGLSTAMFLLDLDGFRDINQSLGLTRGDTLIKQVAQRLQHRFQNEGIVAREGGDEFTVILSKLYSLEDVIKIADSILEIVASPFALEHELTFITTSIGISLYPDHCSSFEQLLRNASQALYTSKSVGPNQYRIFTHEMHEANLRRIKLQNDLRIALEQDQLEVVYQPIIRFSDNVIVKAEALLRWHHPHLGEISPAEFIPIAEMSGQIIKIGDWVFEQALEQAQKCRQHIEKFQISINKSPVQFHNVRAKNHDWIATIRNKGLAGDLITVEITEGLLLDKNIHIDHHIELLREAGMSISLDDFGTGYSSLAYVNHYDIDYLKIDKSFVGGLELGEQKLGLCKAIVSMARELKIELIAEGVETVGQARILKELGCEYAQGFLYSKPVKAGQLLELCKEAVITNMPHEV